MNGSILYYINCIFDHIFCQILIIFLKSNHYMKFRVNWKLILAGSDFQYPHAGTGAWHSAQVFLHLSLKDQPCLHKMSISSSSEGSSQNLASSTQGPQIPQVDGHINDTSLYSEQERLKLVQNSLDAVSVHFRLVPVLVLAKGLSGQALDLLLISNVII